MDMRKLPLVLLTVCFFTIMKAKDNSEWSVAVETGASIFHGDLRNSHTLSNYTVHRPSYGIAAEYCPFPFVGIGVNFNSLYLRADNGSDSFHSIVNNYYPYLSINPIGFFHHNEPSKYKLSARIGYGRAKFNSKSECSIVPIGLGLEYNLSSKIAMGTRTEYIFYATDNLENIPAYNFRGLRNDRLLNIMIHLRYRINRL